jgi:hypothetical protein
LQSVQSFSLDILLPNDKTDDPIRKLNLVWRSLIVSFFGGKRIVLSLSLPLSLFLAHYSIITGVMTPSAAIYRAAAGYAWLVWSTFNAPQMKG